MFEYILLLAGILLIVVLAVVLLRGGIFQGASTDIGLQNCQAALSRLSACYDTAGAWDSAGNVNQPSACANVVDYRDNGSDANDDGTASNGIIECGPQPGQ